MQIDVCRVHYAVDVQYTGSIEHAQNLVTSSAEQPTCPVCLGKFFGNYCNCLHFPGRIQNALALGFWTFLLIDRDFHIES